MSDQTAIEWIIGSHKWGLFQPRHFVDSSPYEGTQDMTPMPNITQLVKEGKATIKKFSDVQPGDALVFDSRIIHGSPANTTTTDEDDNNNNNKTNDDDHDQQTMTTSCNVITGQRRIALRFGGD